MTPKIGHLGGYLNASGVNRWWIPCEHQKLSKSAAYTSG